ncbi:MAG: hypothetical protein IPK67_13475 [Planctomycetes bacterium]|nr:hypothetical protein [Planctomycetota bacterium]
MFQRTTAPARGWPAPSTTRPSTRGPRGNSKSSARSVPADEANSRGPWAGKCFGATASTSTSPGGTWWIWYRPWASVTAWVASSTSAT